MPRGGQTIILPLSFEDRVTTVMHLQKGVMQAFAVQYDTYIDGEWIPIARIDTAHGSAHQHRFSPNGKEVRTEFVCNNYNEGFTNAKKYITENFEHLRNNYLTQAGKGRL